MTQIRKMTSAAFLLALGILLPLAFHGIPQSGQIFSPMHLPVLLAGFVAGPFYGALVGLLTPLLSFLFTGMPIVASLPGMMVELFVYGLSSGLLYRLIKTKNFYVDLYLTLIIAMLLGRAFGGLVNWALYLKQSKDYTWELFAGAYFVKCLPAIAIQLVAVPGLMIALTKTHLISENDRYLNPAKAEAAKAREQATFFDRLAPTWDDHKEVPEEKISGLIAKMNLRPGERVLDVACGTGVLEPFLVKAQVHVRAIDVSGEMIEKAIKEHDDPSIHFQQADFYGFQDAEKYDVIICYNAYPHFSDKDGFAEEAAALLKNGGRLYIVHSLSREKINAIHSIPGAKKPAEALRSPKKEAFPFWKHFKKGYCQDDQDSYVLELIRRNRLFH
jgi:2-polyprenyl-3-methyl-5-hydroxy-6-metoxy-1,4-benzoquinol methylase/predicted membrane protein